ncbi:26295_t:CDS:2 [Dentiscutata erythropus]|uniref:26295_t:CDS:1 n=1 Tax=Dentiscutata erythropus TaxID=1348616 RepID=A0A9N8VYI1_9GLOM|nr:26295_t:CDS:2 [Dentiscutata erythropus]
MSKRYLHNTLTLPNINECDPAKFEKFIIDNIEVILSQYSPANNTHNFDIYNGYGGISFMFFHLHQLFPDLTINENKVSLLCTTYLSASLSAVRRSSPEHVGFLGSHVGPLALAVVVYETIENDTQKSLKYLEIILEKYHSLALNDDWNELLYGRTGYLYSLIFIRKYCKDNKEIMTRIGNEKLKEIIDLIINDGRKRVTTDNTITRPALMWSWYGDEYIGAIHGIVPAFLKIYSLYPTHPSSKNLLSHAIAKTDLVWEHVILRKGATGLCHNTLGNAYTFLTTYLVTRDEEQLKRALAFGLYAGEWKDKTQRGEIRVPDHPWCLFEGLAGGVVYWADLITVLKHVQLGVNIMQDKVVGFPCFTAL